MTKEEELAEFKKKLDKFTLFLEQEYAEYSAEEKLVYRSNMTNQEKELLEEYSKRYDTKMWEALDFFWEYKYPKLSFKDKVNYWGGAIRTSIRMQVEDGRGDKYSGFNPEWRKEILKKEPNIDKIISAAFDKHLNEYADKKEFFRRIKGAEKSTNIFIDSISYFLRKIRSFFK